MKNIDYVIKETAHQLGLPEDKVRPLIKSYWKEIYDSVLSLSDISIAIRYVGILTVSRFKINKYISKRIRKIRITAKRVDISETVREKLLNQHYGKLRTVLKHRNTLAIKYYQDEQKKKKEMSVVKKLEFYLDMVKKGIRNGDKIIESLAVSAQVKNGEISPEALAEILRRKDICAGCPFNSKNADPSLLTPGVAWDEYCVHCLCRIGGDNTKEYCLSCKCGISEYNKKHPEAPMELKWDEFKKPK